MTEDEMIKGHHRHNGHEFEQTLGDSEGQRSQVCCSTWGQKKWNRTEQLNSNNDKAGHPKAVLRVLGWEARWEGVPDGEDTYIPMAHSIYVWQKPSQFRKEYIKAIYFYTVYLTPMHRTSSEMPE